jgi:hypothetical protein
MADYLGIITAQEIEALRNAKRPRMIHPLVHIALAPRDGKYRSLTAFNTEFAAQHINSKNPDWLKALHSRLIATDDFTHAASALGEIRAYGALLETWMTVTPAPPIPGSNASPEFQIDNGDGEVIVEVHSRQLDEEQAVSLDAGAVDLRERHAKAVEKAKEAGAPGNVVTTDEAEVFPTGTPRPDEKGDSVLTNTISRVARIKSCEKQVDPDKPFILWLDFQDFGVWGSSLCDQQFSPLYSENMEGYVGSGAFWFALYGRRGDPLLESRGYAYRSIPMAHEGRFYQTMTKSHGGPTRVSAVVYSLPHATILMENPNAAKPLPPRVRAALLKMPRFRLDLSILEWEPGLVSRLVESQREIVVRATAALGTFDA